MNKRFINVRPFLVDLDEEEKRIGRYEGGLGKDLS
jgi:hypothetical protein